MLGNKARELGFARDAFEKMSRLTEILQYVSADSELNSLLALKGGTAINLALFELPRLSVDIDLDLAENLSKEETADTRIRIRELLDRYMEAEGYTLGNKTRHSYVLDAFICSYINAAGNNDNIKIDINYIQRCHVLPTTMLVTRTGGAFPVFSIRTLHPIEIFAGKINALLTRGAARDLFDVNMMIKSVPFDKEELTLLRKCVVYYCAISGNAANEISFKIMDAITERNIRTSLSQMTRNTEKLDFESVKSQVSSYLSDYLVLSDKESSFLKWFHAGRYEPQLLFDDPEIIKRIENHPMVKWRLQHIQERKDER